MAEYQLNRARMAAAPRALPFDIPNLQTQILPDGVVASAPLVALAYSYATLLFEGNATHSGKRVTIECGGNSLSIVLDSDGCGSISLLPFIRSDVFGSGALDNPLYCESGADFQQNNFRGYIDLAITEEQQLPISLRVHYVFGNYAPKGELVEDVWMDYDANGNTWVNVDAASHYNANGMPVDFEDNWCNINDIIEEEPYGDFVLPLDVAWFYGKDNIQFRTVNYHFHYDCRIGNVLKVRWLDNNGNINTRKFTVGSRTHGASVGSTWQRPHNDKEIILGYDRGKDQWNEYTPTETITIGDDCIPTVQYNWLKSIASSAVVEALMDGVWVRCNINGASIECNPKKEQFSATLTLVLPTDDVQQF